MDDTILQTLRDMAVSRFGVAPDLLDDQTPFAELGMDSLELADFMFEAEDKFGVDIDYKRAMEHPTLAGLAQLIATTATPETADAS